MDCVWAALGAHGLLPFGAYAPLSAAAGFGDVCSVEAKAQQTTASAFGAPAQRPDHTVDHCAFCPSGAVAAAMPPPAPTMLPTRPRLSFAPATQRAALASLCSLSPPSRAPPISA